MFKNMKKKIAIIGGGNGTATVINALKPYVDLYDLSAVITVYDSGGSSGRLREEFGCLPPGDLLRAILAMSKYEYEGLKEVFYNVRFQNAGKLDGHNLGNLILTLFEKYNGDLPGVINALSRALGAVGAVYPVSLDKADLAVELSNGEKIVGEAGIDNPEYDRNLKIKKLRLEPLAEIFTSAKEAIEQADCVILSPGSLYTSLVANLVTDGMKEAIGQSKAELVYVSGNAYRFDGETGPTRLSGFLKVLESYLPRSLNSVVYNDHILSETQSAYYKNKKWALMEYDNEALKKYNIVKADYETEKGGLNSRKLGKILKNVI